MEEFRLFAVLDKDNLVINVIAPPKYIYDPKYDEMVLYEPTHVISLTPNAVRLKEYSRDGSITKNSGAIGYTYDETLNAFIPPKPDDTYVLNEENFRWYPDPNIEYEIDGELKKWKNGYGWVSVRVLLDNGIS